MMMPTRMHIVNLAVAALLACSSVGHAGYVSQSFDSGELAVTFEAYDGNGAAGGGLNAGEVRLTYSPQIGSGNGPGMPDAPGTFRLEGLQSVGFNSDLTLTSPQIQGPTGWFLVSGLKFGPSGQFGWGVATNSNLVTGPATILISGLGSDATFAHFNFGSQGGTSPGGPALFSGRYTVIEITPDGVTGGTNWLRAGTPVPETPEPSSLAIVGLGAAGLALIRRRRG
jgi:hypothetical protein